MALFSNHGYIVVGFKSTFVKLEWICFLAACTFLKLNRNVLMELGTLFVVLNKNPYTY